MIETTRPWSAEPGEPVCGRVYSGRWWTPVPCIKAEHHYGFHADWYGRTWVGRDVPAALAAVAALSATARSEGELSDGR